LRFAVFLAAALLITGLMEVKRRVEESRNRAEEALRQANSDLARVSRVTTMGELTASVAHEVKQPIAASITNAKTCLRWLAANRPNLEEARAAARRIVEDQTRAAEIINRIRVLSRGALRNESWLM
jgi:C4-dicarboxylate-specific signal transduction histidine kinase